MRSSEEEQLQLAAQNAAPRLRGSVAAVLEQIKVELPRRDERNDADVIAVLHPDYYDRKLLDIPKHGHARH